MTLRALRTMWVGTALLAVGCGDDVDSPDNECGGRGALSFRESTATPGHPCGDCHDGTLICGSPDVLVCVGARAGACDAGEAAPRANLCGGSLVLEYDGAPAQPGNACGECGDGWLACDASGTLSCIGASAACNVSGDGGVPQTNACGGTNALTLSGLAALPGDACGPCGSGIVICASPTALICIGGGCSDASVDEPPDATADAAPPTPLDSGANGTPSDAVTDTSCGYAAQPTHNGVPAAKGDPCGPCGDGQLVCRYMYNSLDCAGATPAGYCDAPQNAPNDCTGWGPTLWRGMPWDPGLQCGGCGQGYLICSGQNNLTCLVDARRERDYPCATPEPEEACDVPVGAYSAPDPILVTPAPEPAPTATTFGYIASLGNDLVVDPYRQRLYVSLKNPEPSGATVAFIDPVTEAVTTSLSVGTEASDLGLTDSGSYLWVFTENTHVISKIDLTTNATILEFSVGAGTDSGDITFTPLPGSDESILVATDRALIAYDDGVPRDYAVSSGGLKPLRTNAKSLAFGSDIFAALCVDAHGAHFEWDVDGFRALSGFDFSESVIYAPAGGYDIGARQVIAPLSGYDYASFVVDPASERIFAVRMTAGGWELTAFVPKTLDVLGTAIIPLGGTARPKALSRWGRYGLAFLDDEGTLYIVRTPLVP